MTATWKYLAAAVAGVAVGASAIGLAADKGADKGAAPADRAAMEAVVRDYILAHPEIIPEALTRLEARQTARLIGQYRRQIETPFPGAVAGNPAGDVVLVEYFDYACGFCRQSVADVDRLLAADPGLKVVFRELPILSPASEEAARASLAAAAQGRFLAFHRALYKAGRLSPESIAAARTQAGVTGAAAASAQAELDANLEVARALRFSGTPTFVVGDKVLSGAVGYDTLKAAVDEARAAKRG